MKYEQFTVGQLFQTNPVMVTRDEIMLFGNLYDPQYFHIDEEKAQQSHYGDLIASGFHTIGKVWAEWIKMNVLGEDCLGGLSASDIHWKRPVYPEDHLHADIEIVQKSLMGNERGIVTLAFNVKKQNEKTVLTFLANVLMATREKH